MELRISRYWPIIAVCSIAVIGTALTLIPSGVFGAWKTAGIVIAIVSISFFAILERLVLPERIERMKRDAERKRRAKEIANQFSAFLQRISTDKTDIHRIGEDTILAASEPLEKSIPELLALASIKGLDKGRLDCLVVLWLADYWLRAKEKPGGNAIEIFNILDGSFRSAFPTVQFSEKSKQLMLAYKKVRQNWLIVGTKRPVASLFTGKLPHQEYQGLMHDFLAQTGQQHLYEVMRADKSESLRANLIRLVTEGRLSSRGLRQDVLDKMQEEIRRYGASNDALLIFKNKFKELEGFLQSVPNLKPKSAVVARGFGIGEDPLLYQIVVKLPKHYRDANHFVDAEIRPRIKSKDGFVAVVPLNLLDSTIFPSQKDFTEKGFIATNYQVVNRLLTGLDRPDLDIWMLLAKHEVSVEEVLANLPLSVMAVGLSADAADELWRKNGEIKKKFHIRTLPDWAAVDPRALANYLSRNMLSFALMENDQVETECKSIIEEARRVRASLSPTQSMFE